jgi:hypothetical protein
MGRTIPKEIIHQHDPQTETLLSNECAVHVECEAVTNDAVKWYINRQQEVKAQTQKALQNAEIAWQVIRRIDASTAADSLRSYLNDARNVQSFAKYWTTDLPSAVRKSTGRGEYPDGWLGWRLISWWNAVWAWPLRAITLWARTLFARAHWGVLAVSVKLIGSVEPRIEAISSLILLLTLWLSANIGARNRPN